MTTERIFTPRHLSNLLRLIVSLLLTAMIGLMAAHDAQAADQVPFSGTFTTTSLGAPCAPLTVCISAEGSGQATHLGRTEIAKNVVLQITFAPCPGGLLRTYTLDQTLTAANGDTLTMSGSGTSCASPDGSVAASGSFNVTGGTGRFSGASGTIMEHVVRVGTGPEIITLTGTISSPGSVK